MLLLILVACRTKQTPQEVQEIKPYVIGLPCGERLEGFKCEHESRCEFVTTKMEENYVPKEHISYGYNLADGVIKTMYKESRCK